MSSFKDDMIEEITDMLDSLSTVESLKIFRKLTSNDLVSLSSAIRKYGEEQREHALKRHTCDDA